MISLHPKFEPIIYRGSINRKMKPETIAEFALKAEDMKTNSAYNKYDHV